MKRRRRLSTPPEPARVADLGEGREEDAEEYGGGGESHGEGMKRRDGAEGDGTAAAEEVEDEVEDEGGGVVEGDGVDEEGPSGSP